MAGGGVVADTSLALNRRCWSFDMADRAENRPEIEPYFWDNSHLKWPVNGKTKPDLILFDPPYFNKKAETYDNKSISGLARDEYLNFLERFFILAHENSKKTTTLALINADWPPARIAYASESGIFRTQRQGMKPGGIRF